MKEQTYFYHFIQPISKELAYVARELENSIYTSPRTMLTHSRIFIETIVHKVISQEKLKNHMTQNLKENIDLLQVNDLLPEKVIDALHHIRMAGNQAAHQVRPFRFSESLLTWEHIYIIVKWYIEVYGPIEVDVPDYYDPLPKSENNYDSTELESRLERLERLLTETLNPTDATVDETMDDEETYVDVSIDEQPGFTIIRSIQYKDNQLDIPYFLRDAFLLPQRFSQSERFLIRLGAEQEARIMSELPDQLDGLHTYVTRYNESHDREFFTELKTFVSEEKERFQLQQSRPGELFFFFHTDYIVVTKKLAETPISTESFSGFPSFIKQLNDQGFTKVGQLPNELITLAKYKRVGEATIKSFFDQLKEK